MTTATRAAPAGAAPKRGRDGTYPIDGMRLISATTVLDRAIPKQKSLVPWAGNCVARAAINEAPKLARMRGQEARDAMYEHLRLAHAWEKEAAGNLGSEIHQLVEDIALGKPLKPASDKAIPYLPPYRNFAKRWVADTLATEMVVANPEHGWAGTLDLIAVLQDLPGVATLGDFKTGRGVYPEFALQLAAYRHATICFLKDGTRFVMADEFAPIERAVIVHLRPDTYPDTGYRVIPIDTGPEVYATFLAALEMTRQWTEKRQKTLIGEPLTLNEDEEVA